MEATHPGSFWSRPPHPTATFGHLPNNKSKPHTVYLSLLISSLLLFPFGLFFSCVHAFLLFPVVLHPQRTVPFTTLFSSIVFVGGDPPAHFASLFCASKLHDTSLFIIISYICPFPYLSPSL